MARGPSNPGSGGVGRDDSSDLRSSDCKRWVLRSYLRGTDCLEGADSGRP